MSYIGKAILDHIFNNVLFAPPARLWIALHTSSGEVVGGNYSRVDITGKFNIADDNDVVTNSMQITFPKPTVGWGTIVSGGIYDASEGGNLIIGGPMQNPFSAPPNTDVFINAGILRFGFTMRS